MFVVYKKRKPIRTIDLVFELFADCVRLRSFKPMRLLYGTGRYGSHGCLVGSYKDYRNWCEKTGRRKEIAIAKR